MPLQSRRDICCHESGFDWNCSAPAEGVNQNPVRLPWSQHDQTGREIFGDRSFHGHLSVSAFVERLTGRVETDCDLILHEEDADRISASVLRENLHLITPFHLLDHRLLADALDVGRGEELRPDGRSLCDPEFRVAGQQFVPRERIRALEEIVKTLRMEGPDLEENALCRAETDIGTGDGFCVADEADPTVAHLGNFIAEIIDFIFQDALETEMAGSNQFISFSMHELILKRGGILRNRAYMFSDSTDYVFRTYRLFLTLPVRM